MIHLQSGSVNFIRRFPVVSETARKHAHTTRYLTGKCTRNCAPKAVSTLVKSYDTGFRIPCFAQLRSADMRLDQIMICSGTHTKAHTQRGVDPHDARGVPLLHETIQHGIGGRAAGIGSQRGW